MELVEGETLAQRLKAGALPVKLVLLYASQIVSALIEAPAKFPLTPCQTSLEAVPMSGPQENRMPATEKQNFAVEPTSC